MLTLTSPSTTRTPSASSFAGGYSLVCDALGRDAACGAAIPAASLPGFGSKSAQIDALISGESFANLHAERQVQGKPETDP